MVAFSQRSVEPEVHEVPEDFESASGEEVGGPRSDYACPRTGHFDAETDLYQYEPLESLSTIRLLRLEPWEERIDPREEDHYRVSCTVYTTALYDANRLRYNALSYTWGNPMSPHQASGHTTKEYWIQCDGMRLKVGENLYHALLRLSRLSSQHLSWIDAICIDQEDVEERSSQVAIMGKIFAQADQVIAWLGEEDQDSRTALPLIADFMDTCRSTLDFGRLVARIDEFAFNDPRFYREFGLAPITLME